MTRPLPLAAVAARHARLCSGAPRPRIALDVQFSPDDATSLRAMGFEIVAHAEHGEPDRSVLERAHAASVQMVCSPDSDWEIWAYDHDVWFCQVPARERVDLPNLVEQAWWERSGRR